MADLDKMVEELSKLTVLEAAELSKNLGGVDTGREESGE